jgi:hypothetical protein
VLASSTGVKASEVLSNELKSSEQLQLVPLKQEKVPAPKPVVSPGPARDNAALADARDRAAKADDLIKKLKFPQAAEELTRVIGVLESQHPFIDFNDLVAAHLNIAVAYFRLGQDADGEKALAQVVRLEPDKKLDAERYPPVFLRAFDNVSKKVKKGAHFSIKVEPTSPGAQVVLDGHEVGAAPLVIKDVIKGPHYLKVGEVWANKVDAPAGDSIRIAPDLGSPGGPVAEIIALLARNTIDDQLIGKVVALTQQTPADFVVLGGVHKEGDGIVVSSHLLKVASKKTCLLQRVVFDQEMLGAGIEIYKVGADITNKLDVFGDEEKLPAKVARDALAPSGKTLVAVSVGGSGEGGDRVVRVKPTDKPASDQPKAIKTDVRKVTATSEPTLVPIEPVGPGEEPSKVKEPTKTWVWVVIGVAAAAVVAGGATGGYFLYKAGTKPISGTGTISW